MGPGLAPGEVNDAAEPGDERHSDAQETLGGQEHVV